MVLASRIGRGPGTPIVRMGLLPGRRGVGLLAKVTPAILHRSTRGCRLLALDCSLIAASSGGDAEVATQKKSVRLPDRIIAEQATVGKADVVNQKQAEGETDKARGNAKLPVEPRQVRCAEREWGDQQHGDQH